MKKLALPVLRIGLGVTFLWIGILVFKDPEGWGAYLQPWAADLLPIDIGATMTVAGVFDIVLGILMILNLFVWPLAFLGAFHLLVVLIVTGINAITVRDIGLLAACLSLLFETWPSKHFLLFKVLKK